MQAGDEVGFGGCFAQGGYEVVPVGICQRAEGGAHREGGTFQSGERDVAWVIWGWAVEDGEGTDAEGHRKGEEAVKEGPGSSRRRHD